MFGASYSIHGSPHEVLSLSHQLIRPCITSLNQVLIRVHAASINPIDYKLLGGGMSAVVKQKFPYTPGFDVAGVVVEVGAGCKRIKVGDEVWGDLGQAGGSFADYALANENDVALKPTNLSFGEAAAVPLAALTSYQALVKHGGLKAGHHVLILNGAGGTGSYAIQIGKALGASVTVTCSARNAAFCQYLGADRIMDYGKTEWWNGTTKYDIIYDCVGQPLSWQHAKLVLAKYGIFVTITGDNPDEKVSIRTLLGTVATIVGRKVASIFTKHRYHWFLAYPDPTDLNVLKELFETNKMKPIIEKYYSIEGHEKADEKEGLLDIFQHIMSGRTRGKLVLEIHQAGERRVFDFTGLPAYVEPVEDVKEEMKQPISAITR